MTALALALAAAVAAAGPGAGAACRPAAPGPGPGVTEPFKAPEPQATALNADGKLLYRTGKWEEARAKYRAASAADPSFLAPRLNVACSYVRQERFAEATAEVRALIDAAYLPWSREVLEAADLGALKAQPPQWHEIEGALAAAAQAWGAGLDEAVVFVGRQRAPLHVPPQGEGEFILNPHQEVYAFLPATGRFRQLTAADGHVVAVAVAPDRRRIAFVTAEKLVRGAKPGDASLDRVALHELTLATMALSPPVPIAGAVRRIEIGGTPHGFAYAIDGPHIMGRFLIDPRGTLIPLGGTRLGGPALAALTAAGAQAVRSMTVAGSCPVSARDGKGAVRTVVVTARGRTPRTIDSTFGAGLAGLPLP